MISWSGPSPHQTRPRNSSPGILNMFYLLIKYLLASCSACSITVWIDSDPYSCMLRRKMLVKVEIPKRAQHTAQSWSSLLYQPQFGWLSSLPLSHPWREGSWSEKCSSSPASATWPNTIFILVISIQGILRCYAATRYDRVRPRTQHRRG